MSQLPALIAGLLMVAAVPAYAAPDAAKAAADSWRAGHEKAILSEFTDFLAMPNVATTIPDVERNADHLIEMLRARGFAARTLSAGPGTPPTVYGELKTPGVRRTVLYYAHYDGQPVGQKGWASPPFTPVMRSGPLGPGSTTVDWRATAPPLWKRRGSTRPT